MEHNEIEQIEKPQKIVHQNHEFPHKIHPKKKNRMKKCFQIPDIKKDKKRKPNKMMFPKTFLR